MQNLHLAYAKQGNLQKLKPIHLTHAQQYDCMLKATKHDRSNIVEYLLNTYKLVIPNLLLTSAIANSFNVAKLLVNNGYNVNFYKNGSSPLAFFVKHNNLDAIHFFLSNGATLEYSLIQFTINNKYYDSTKLLLKYTPANSIKDYQSILLSAIYSEQFDIANTLLDLGLNLNDPYVTANINKDWNSLRHCIRTYVTNQKRLNILTTI